MTATREELLERNLPKWPQMIVTGSPVTQEQAMEIIRRTDIFFVGGHGNDHVFDKQATLSLRMPEYPNQRNLAYHTGDKDADDDRYFKDLRNYWDKIHAWRDSWGIIECEYVVNEWISASFAGGPHGWCHPDGTIGFSDNVGKHPSPKEIMQDWETLAKEFPFINVEVTLMDGESCESDTKPVISFLVHDGTVDVIDPADGDIHAAAGHEKPKATNFEAHMIQILTGNNAVTHAISMWQIQKWGEEYAAHIKE